MIHMCVVLRHHCVGVGEVRGKAEWINPWRNGDFVSLRTVQVDVLWNVWLLAGRIVSKPC